MSPPRPLMPLKNNIHFKAEHIPGKSNIIVGAICRKQWEVFRKETFPSTNPSQVSDDISGEVKRLLECSIATNTNQTYEVGLQSYSQFRNAHGLQEVWPSPKCHINKFIAHMSLKVYKPSTASVYKAGISFYWKLNCGIGSTKHIRCKNYYRA